ncbi:MAG: hypothetical protein FWE82_08930 [Defluviitaleaceae bacterium]|nr:hypothetical protein [Defluviitaleaceae bacterium]
MERQFVSALEALLPELKGNIYPTNAPKTSQRPYLVYYRDGTDYIKTLDGCTGSERQDYVFNVMAERYADMKHIAGVIIGWLLELSGADVGEVEPVTVQELTINNIAEAYENNLSVHRAIIDFTVYI